MRKYQLYLNIWLLFCLVVSPLLFWEMFFGGIFQMRNFLNNDISNGVSICIFGSAYVIFPLFFIYQIILKLKKKLKPFYSKLTLISFIVFMLSVVFYSLLYYIIDEAVTRTHQESKLIEYNEGN